MDKSDLNDSQIEARLAAARTAMGGNRLLKKQEAKEKDWEEKRKLAALSMAGPAYRKKQKQKEAELQKRRGEARAAMIGTDKIIKQKQKESTLEKLKALRKKEKEKNQQKKVKSDTPTQEPINDKLDSEKKEKLQIKSDPEKEKVKQEAQKLIKKLSKNPESDLKPYRTLETDTYSSVIKNKLSAADISMTETKKRERGADPETKLPTKSRLIRSLVIVFVGLLTLSGAGLGFFIYWQYQQPEENININENGLLPADKNIALDTTNKNRDQIIKEITTITTRPGLNHIYFIYQAGPESRPTRAGLSVVNNIIDLNWPDNFTRFLTENFMLGQLTENSTEGFFILLQSRSINHTFENLLNSGKELTAEFWNTLDITWPENELESGQFEDVLISNINVRHWVNTVETDNLSNETNETETDTDTQETDTDTQETDTDTDTQETETDTDTQETDTDTDTQETDTDTDTQETDTDTDTQTETNPTNTTKINGPAYAILDAHTIAITENLETMRLLIEIKQSGN
ncbi:MAG: hypothetical protein ACOCU8_02625 [Patescibacteria group bacterium]